MKIGFTLVDGLQGVIGKRGGEGTIVLEISTRVVTGLVSDVKGFGKGERRHVLEP